MQKVRTNHKHNDMKKRYQNNKDYQSPLLNAKKSVQENQTLIEPTFERLKMIHSITLQLLTKQSIEQLYIMKNTIESVKDPTIKKDFEMHAALADEALAKSITKEPLEKLSLEELKERLSFLWKLYPKKEPIWSKEGGLHLVGIKTERKAEKEAFAAAIYERLKKEMNLECKERLEEYYWLYRLAPSYELTHNSLKKDIKKLTRTIEREEKRKREIENDEAEKKRIAKLDANPELIVPCPNCGYKYEKVQEQRKGNGVYGPGYRSWVVKSWRTCSKCNTTFDMKNG